MGKQSEPRSVRGLEPLFESRTLWGPEDAALILVKTLDAPG
jgi:hypothetical protein